MCAVSLRGPVSRSIGHFLQSISSPLLTGRPESSKSEFRKETLLGFLEDNVEPGSKQSLRSRQTQVRATIGPYRVLAYNSDWRKAGMRLLLFLGSLAVAAWAQSPQISAGGVVSAGLSPVPSQVIAPNAILSIFGTNFAPPGFARDVTSGDLVLLGLRRRSVLLDLTGKRETEP